MINKILLTKPIFEWLVEQLVFIEEGADELARFCYPILPDQEKNMKALFLEYVKKIEAELEKVCIIDSIDKFRHSDTLNRFPFVIIGSQVKLTDLSDNSKIHFKIVHPIAESKSQRYNEITYLSPLGKELLMKGVRMKVEANTQAGAKRFRVESIMLL